MEKIMPTRDEMLESGFTHEEISKWQQEETATLTEAGFNSAEIRQYIGAPVKAENVFNNPKMQGMFQSKEQIQYALPYADREEYQNAVRAVNGKDTGEKLASALFISKKHGILAEDVINNYQNVMDEYFDEELAPSQHYAKIGEMMTGTTPQEDAQAKARIKSLFNMPQEDKIGSALNVKGVGATKATFNAGDRFMTKEQMDKEFEAKYKELHKPRKVDYYNEPILDVMIKDSLGEGAFATVHPTLEILRGFGGIYMNFADDLSRLIDTQYQVAKAAVTGDEFQPNEEMEKWYQVRQQARAFEQANRRKDMPWLTDVVVQAGEQAMLAGTAAIVGSGALAPTAGFYSTMAITDIYAKLRDDNVDPIAAFPTAVFGGALNGAQEVAFNTIPGFKTIFKKPQFFLNILGEVLTEGTQKLTEDVFVSKVAPLVEDTFTLNNPADRKQVAVDLAKNMWDEMVNVFPVVTLTAAFGFGFQKLDPNYTSDKELWMVGEMARQRMNELREEKRKDEQAVPAAETAPAEQAETVAAVPAPVADTQAALPVIPDPTSEMNASEIRELHEVRDKKKKATILQSMKEKGYVGRPILVIGDSALTGSHRLAVARELDINVPVYELDYNDVQRAIDEIGDNYGPIRTVEEVGSLDDEFKFEFFNQASTLGIADDEFNAAARILNAEIQANTQTAPTAETAPAALVADEAQAAAPAQAEEKTEPAKMGFTPEKQAELDTFEKYENDPEGLIKHLKEASGVADNIVGMAFQKHEDEMKAKYGENYAELGGLNNARLNALRKLIQAPEIAPFEKITMARAIAEVMDSRLIDNVDAIAAEVIAKKDRTLSPQESVAFDIRLAEVTDEWLVTVKQQQQFIAEGKLAAAQSLQAYADTKHKAMTDISYAGLKAGNISGKNLAARRWNAAISRKMSQTFMWEVDVASNGTATQEQKDAARELQGKLQLAELKVEELQAELAKERERADAVEASVVIKEIVTNTTKRSKDKVGKDIESLKAKFARSLGSANLNLNPEQAGLLLRLMKAYVESGITNARALSEKVLEDFPDVSQEDVFEVLARKNKPGQEKKVVNAINKTMRLLKKQAELELEVMELSNELDNPTTADLDRIRQNIIEMRKIQNETELDENRLAKINERLNNIVDMTLKMYQKVKKKRPLDTDEIKQAKLALSEATSYMNTIDRNAELKDQLETGNYEDLLPQRRIAIRSERLELAKAEKRNLERKARDMIEMLRPRGVGEQVFDKFSAANQTLRAIQASADMSGYLRQGLMLIGHQSVSGVQGWKNIGNALKISLNSTFNQAYFDMVQTAIKEDGFNPIREAHGLKLSDPDGRITTHEEYFVSNFFKNLKEKVPGLSYLDFVGASERNMVGFLNMMRVAAFDTVVKANPQWTADNIKDWAKTVNAMSGKTSWLDRIPDSISKATSFAFFAPGFALSRIEVQTRLISNLFDPALRKESAKAFMGNVILQGTWIGLATLAGGKIGDDLEEFDFLRMSFGNNKVDLFAGLNHSWRVFMGSALWAFDEWVNDGKKRLRSPSDLAKSMVLNKRGPFFSYWAQLAFGEDFMGNPKERSKVLQEMFTPMVANGFFDIYDSAGEEFISANNLVPTAMSVPGGAVVSIDNKTLQPDVREIVKHADMKSIPKIEWDEPFKTSREYIERRNELQTEFYERVADKIQAKSYMLSLKPERAKEIISEIVSQEKERIKRKAPKGVKK